MKSKIFIVLTLLLILISILLFGKGQPFNLSLPINAERFNQFGGFMAGLLSGASLILLIFTYNETKIQTFENSFYNHLQINDSITLALRNNSKEIEKLNNVDYKNLFLNNFCSTIQMQQDQDECYSYEKMNAANDYFEITYRILHVRHKYKNELEQFYKDYNWQIGHYIRSFISIVKLISESKFAANGHQYIRILKARSSNDELRLLFYYILGVQNQDKKCSLAKLFSKYDLFDDLTELIKDGDMDSYRNILKNCK
ncbi:MAG: hypothetical protein JST87_18935 [Bacteroidetes bacterium]|nr:hypothetical protein [Bacteroidota bacterium]